MRDGMPSGKSEGSEVKKNGSQDGRKEWIKRWRIEDRGTTGRSNGHRMREWMQRTCLCNILVREKFC